jgi:ABC-type glycerol-3-phosphate transport system permease component
MATQDQVIVQERFQPSEISRLRKMSFWQLVLEIVKYTALIVLSISFLLPFYWMFTSALKDDIQVFSIPPIWIPNPAHWNNFMDAWTTLDFNLYAFNTIFKYALPGTIGTVLSSAIVAYGFSRIRWPGRDILFSICLMTMMVPGQVRQVPLFVTFKQLGWLNTFKPLVIPRFFASAYFVFMLRQFFMSIPGELSDAAKIDGASELGIFWRIMLPLSRPALAVVALFSFMGAWNDYFGPLIYVNIAEQWVLALGLNKLRSSVYEIGYSQMDYPYMMAVSAIITLPIVIAFFFTQRSFIEGISLTGLKG